MLGGSLVPVGGHNPIEAAVHGIPLLMGPHRFNWTEIADRFADAGCLHLVGKGNLASVAADLLGDRRQRQLEGRAGLEVVASNRGASDRLLVRLEACVGLPGR